MIALQCCVSAVQLNQLSVYVYPLPLEPPCHSTPLSHHRAQS